MAHALVQLFNGLLDQRTFAICNAMVYPLLIIMLGHLGNVRIRENYGGLFSAAVISIICFITKMMPTCQIGYIWAMTANMLWLYFFFTSRRPSWAKVAVMFLLGAIAGNWQESVSLGVCAGTGCWWLSQFGNRSRRKRWFDWRRSWMLLGYVLGTASVCLSPSTMSRVSTVETPLSDQILVASYSLTAVCMLVISTIIMIMRKKRLPAPSFQLKEDGIPGACLLAAMIFLLAFNFAVGIFSNRQLFGANMFAAILLLRLLPHHRLPLILNAMVGVAVIALWIAMQTGIGQVRRQYDEISALHAASPDGTVEYDRVRVTILGHPSDAKYYEDVVGQFDNDLHHSIMKEFKHTKGGKTLKLKPTTPPDTDNVARYAPGHFNVTTEMPRNGEPPREITIYGHYSLLGVIDIPAPPRKLQISRYSRMRPPFGTATIIPEYPLFLADSISF